MEETNILRISYLNIRGQTGLPIQKQLQIENLLKYSQTDILHLQETDVDQNTFKECLYTERGSTTIITSVECT